MRRRQQAGLTVTGHVPQPHGAVVACGGDRAAVGTERDAADEVGVAVHDPGGAGRARGLDRADEAAPGGEARARLVRVERQQERDVEAVVELLLRRDAQPQRGRGGRRAAGRVALRERPEGERCEEGGDHGHQAAAHEQPAPLLLAALQLAAVVDPRDEEFAGDLVEVDVATALAAHEPRLALESPERALEQAAGDALLLGDAVEQVRGGDDVARAGLGHHLPEQRDRRPPHVRREGVERLAEVVLQQPLELALPQQARGVARLPQPQAHDLDLRQRDVAALEALAERRLQLIRHGWRELALEHAGVALERPADDRPERLARRRREAQRLVDQVRAGAEQLVDASEVVLAEDEQHLHGQVAVDQLDQQVDHTLPQRLGVRLVEQRHQLLELVEHQQRMPVLAGRLHALRERRGREDGARRVVAAVRQQRRQQRRRVVAGGDALQHDLLVCARLHAQALGTQAELRRLGDQAGVHERRLAGPGVAVEHRSAVDGDEIRQLGRLRLAREEDRPVDGTERADAAERPRRRDDEAEITDRYGSSPLSNTCRYRSGTNVHTSSTTKRR